MSNIKLADIWVNYAWCGMDEGKPCEEAAGTLIHTMSHGIVVKLDSDAFRKATEDEVTNWTGPISPSWAEYYARK